MYQAQATLECSRCVENNSKSHCAADLGQLHYCKKYLCSWLSEEILTESTHLPYPLRVRRIALKCMLSPVTRPPVLHLLLEEFQASSEKPSCWWRRERSNTSLF